MLSLLVTFALSHSGLCKIPNSGLGHNLDNLTTVIKEKIGSYLITPQMTGVEVERLMGQPFGVDSFGPPGEFYVVYSYLASGINITFGPDGKVKSVER
ncbi:hypothetical protein GobsT_32130 [Gemmata obscuriglobus]|uniref:Lipoprotein SmpA/OmlA domain-containing protein n=1 Tax=Gemmata obscuriglobus TaxID=114 RepID=A0A2Z3GYT6_9BACT|nr:hypothetical protein [Gemmata obscuriglobus]AWM38608.1 hypothetical protein C1280_17535 [Gemmata obscuriglobus]QEG28434.1 hypothetical protein GobsT_32130 [Gemmata obscuriglobus]VTS06406.1 unnamed protein product [Gemmata obscuriglobus UQM 2246]